MSLLESRQLSPTEELELDQLLSVALELIPLPPGLLDAAELPPEAVIQGIADLVDALRSGEPLPEGLDLETLSAALGVLWGEELVRQVPWSWRMVQLEGEPPIEALALVRPDAGALVLPVFLIARALRELREEPAFALLARLIVSGQYPECPPESWRILG